MLNIHNCRFVFHTLLVMLLCISELCWLRNRKTFHFKCDSQIVFRKLFWQNAPFTPWVQSLNRKTDVCVWCTRRPLLTEKDDKETDSTDTADLTGACEEAVKETVHMRGWIIDVPFKQPFWDIIELESLSWNNNAHRQLTPPLKLICHLHCSGSGTTTPPPTWALCWYYCILWWKS